MSIFKNHPLLKLVNSYIIDSPQPSNISYLCKFGSLYNKGLSISKIFFNYLNNKYTSYVSYVSYNLVFFTYILSLYFGLLIYIDSTIFGFNYIIVGIAIAIITFSFAYQLSKNLTLIIYTNKLSLFICVNVLTLMSGFLALAVFYILELNILEYHQTVCNIRYFFIIYLVIFYLYRFYIMPWSYNNFIEYALNLSFLCLTLSVFSFIFASFIDAEVYNLNMEGNNSNNGGNHPNNGGNNPNNGGNNPNNGGNNPNNGGFDLESNRRNGPRSIGNYDPQDVVGNNNLRSSILNKLDLRRNHRETGFWFKNAFDEQGIAEFNFTDLEKEFIVVKGRAAMTGGRDVTVDGGRLYKDTKSFSPERGRITVSKGICNTAEGAHDIARWVKK